MIGMHYKTPDTHATVAETWSKCGMQQYAFDHAVCAVKARAEWVLVNGKWVPRKGVMRHD